MGDTKALSEEGHTPRQEFIRKMLSMGRMPVPILLRQPSALQDLNLAHRGLGDDVMCAASEVSGNNYMPLIGPHLKFSMYPTQTLLLFLSQGPRTAQYAIKIKTQYDNAIHSVQRKAFRRQWLN